MGHLPVQNTDKISLTGESKHDNGLIKRLINVSKTTRTLKCSLAIGLKIHNSTQKVLLIHYHNLKCMVSVYD